MCKRNAKRGLFPHRAQMSNLGDAAKLVKREGVAPLLPIIFNILSTKIKRRLDKEAAFCIKSDFKDKLNHWFNYLFFLLQSYAILQRLHYARPTFLQKHDRLSRRQRKRYNQTPLDLRLHLLRRAPGLRWA